MKNAAYFPKQSDGSVICDDGSVTLKMEMKVVLQEKHISQMEMTIPHPPR